MTGKDINPTKIEIITTLRLEAVSFRIRWAHSGAARQAACGSLLL